ncbi:MAG: pirin family protein [Chitinophagales bacterium]
MELIIHKAAERGHANHGWLNAWHSFSFANFYDPAKIQFGALRVLNDDTIAPGMGFGMHPHNNMEIITIPLEGSVRHRDSMGNEGLVKAGEVQVMSAGTGILHSEVNGSTVEPLKLFQIWIFPEKEQLTPRYNQKSFDTANRSQHWQLLVSADGSQNSLTIHQKARIARATIEAGQALSYPVHHEGNGIYLMVVEGSAAVLGLTLSRRDAIGLTDASAVEIHATEKTEVLVLEVPMN